MEWIGQKEQEEGNCPILSHGFDSIFDVWAPLWNMRIWKINYNVKKGVSIIKFTCSELLL